MQEAIVLPWTFVIAEADDDSVHLEFQVFGHKWKIEVVKEDSDDDSDDESVHLCATLHHLSDDTITVNWTLDKLVDGAVVHSQCASHFRCAGGKRSTHELNRFLTMPSDDYKEQIHLRLTFERVDFRVRGLQPEFLSLLDSGLESDIKLVVDDSEIAAHRCILSARCEYFRKMLASKMQESEKNVVHFEGMNVSAFKQVLRYIYAGECPPCRSSDEEKKGGSSHEKKLDSVDPYDIELSNVLIAADTFTLSELVAFCEDKLQHLITTKNAADLLMVADAHHARLLKKQVLLFLQDDIRRAEVMDTEAFQRLSLPLMHELVQMTTRPFTSKKRSRAESESLMKADVKRLKLSTIRAELEHRGLDLSGLKTAMVERLENALSL